MRNAHGLTVVRCADAVAPPPPDEALSQLSRSLVRIRRRVDGLYGTSRAEPAAWSDAQLEDVIATLDGVADIAAHAADRLRGYRDSMV